MLRFKLYLVERPTRAAPILDALVNDPAVGMPREVLDGFIVGKVEGPVLILADDDHERVQGYWERCNRDGLAVCIFDHSTVLDRLRDRIRSLGRPKPEAPSPSPSQRPNAPSSLLTPSVQKRDIALVEPGFLDHLPRLRAALLGAVVFALLLGVAWWMVPPRDEPEAAASSQHAAPAPNTASGRPLRVHAGGGTQTAAQAPRADGHAGGGAGGIAPTALADAPRIEVEVSQHGDASAPAPARSDRPSLVPLLLAFVAGLAGSWGAGEAVSRRGASMPRARRRALIAGVATLAVLVTAVSIAVRVSALSPAPPQPARPPPSEAPQAPSAHPVAAAPAESGGPFARFLRRHRGTGATTPPPSFASLLAGWRARRVDAAAPAAREETAVAAAPDAGARRHRRRHRRHAESRHAAHASDRVATDAGSATARAESADAATVAETPVAAAGEAPAQGAPSPSVARAQIVASAAATPPEPEAPPPHEAAQQRPHPVAARPRARRSSPSPFVGLALGVLAGLALSPRWRAFARGGDA